MAQIVSSSIQGDIDLDKVDYRKCKINFEKIYKSETPRFMHLKDQYIFSDTVVRGVSK